LRPCRTRDGLKSGDAGEQVQKATALKLHDHLHDRRQLGGALIVWRAAL
jgi:hypothetical protein